MLWRVVGRENEALVGLLALEKVGYRVIVHWVNQESTLHAHYIGDVGGCKRNHLLGLDLDEISLIAAVSQAGKQNHPL